MDNKTDDPYAGIERAILSLSDSLKLELQTRPDRLRDAGGTTNTLTELARATAADLRALIGLTDLILSQQQQINDLTRAVVELHQQ